MHSWEMLIAQHAMVAAGAGYKPLIGPVTLSLDFRFPIPKGRKELQPGNGHLQDPDLTNLLKAAEDGLKRVLFADDNLVCRVSNLHKYWVLQGDEGMKATVWIDAV